MPVTKQECYSHLVYYGIVEAMEYVGNLLSTRLNAPNTTFRKFHKFLTCVCIAACPVPECHLNQTTELLCGLFTGKLQVVVVTTFL